MFVGACAGSTGGGMKISRFVILFKSLKREIKKLVHPNSVSNITFEGSTVDENVVKGVNGYFGIMMCIIFASLIVLSFDKLDFETNFTAIIACVNNIGPGFSLVGPMGNYSCFNDFSKIILSALMLIGRLEIYPILLLFMPKLWFNK
jgi:trk system potassium uptake protein TrkH